ncbi:MAG: Txe/YoeB family addiction module toxin [Prevotellaceae bacterium]|jgi:toxin YoeB|nr:Txe/YoeB family addiction module toxin [Prevotellaceae bacterium]
MIYQVKLDITAKNDILKYKMSGDKKLLKKIHSLLEELKGHPKTGTGKPEQLKYYETPTWSRRISDKHRLVYQIHENIVTVLVVAAFGHYEDK